jgi:hypothetical protein
METGENIVLLNNTNMAATNQVRISVNDKVLCLRYTGHLPTRNRLLTSQTPCPSHLYVQ